MICESKSLPRLLLTPMAMESAGQQEDPVIQLRPDLIALHALAHNVHTVVPDHPTILLRSASRRDRRQPEFYDVTNQHLVNATSVSPNLPIDLSVMVEDWSGEELNRALIRTLRTHEHLNPSLAKWRRRQKLGAIGASGVMSGGAGVLELGKLARQKPAMIAGELTVVAGMGLFAALRVIAAIKSCREPGIRAHGHDKTPVIAVIRDSTTSGLSY